MNLFLCLKMFGEVPWTHLLCGILKVPVFFFFILNVRIILVANEVI